MTQSLFAGNLRYTERPQARYQALEVKCRCHLFGQLLVSIDKYRPREAAFTASAPEGSECFLASIKVSLFFFLSSLLLYTNFQHQNIRAPTTNSHSAPQSIAMCQHSQLVYACNHVRKLIRSFCKSCQLAETNQY